MAAVYFQKQEVVRNMSRIKVEIWYANSVSLIECETSPNQKAEVDLWRYGHHLEFPTIAILDLRQPSYSYIYM